MTWKLTQSVRLSLLLIILIVIGILAGYRFFPGDETRIQDALFQQNLFRAKAITAEALAEDPQNPQLLALQARIERHLGRFDEMNAHLRRAIKAGLPRDELKRQQVLASAQTGNLPPVEEELRLLLSGGESLSEVCDAYVRGLVLQYRIQDAKKLITIWSSDIPQDSQPHFHLGRLLEHESEYDVAQQEFETALTKSSENVLAAYNLARILVSLKNYEAALEQYEMCRKLLWIQTPALVGMADCLIELERYEEARQTLDLIEGHDSEEVADVYRFLGDPSYLSRSRRLTVEGKLLLREDQINEAIDRFQEALKLSPLDWKTRYQLGLALRQNGQTELAQEQLDRYAASQQALSQCEKFIDRVHENPADIEARIRIARVMLEHVSVRQGIVWLQSVLAIDPTHAEARKLLQRYSVEQPAQ